MVFSLAKRLQGKGQPLEKGVHLFYSQVGRDKLSLFELNKGTLVYNQAERHGPLRQAIKYDYNNKSNEKQVKVTVFNMESELTFPCNTLSSSLLLPVSSASCKENILFKVKQSSCS